MPAPEGNQNASKPAGERKESLLHLRVKTRDKARWVKAATKAGQKLAQWVSDTLNKEANKK